MNVKVRFRFEILVTIVMALFLPGIYSRRRFARLIDPPPRRSLWRLGYPTPKDINDAAPVFTRQTINYDSSLRLCGQPAMQSSKKLKTYVVQQYIQGIPMEVKVTKSFGLFGSASFALCDISDGNTISDECFHENVLNVLKTEQMASSKRRMNETILLTLSPPQIKCEHCVLQWKYTIKSTACPRCDPLYQFISCADIAIVDPKDIQYMNVMMSRRQKRQAPNSPHVGTTNSEFVFFPQQDNVAVSHPTSDTTVVETHSRLSDGSGVPLRNSNGVVVSSPTMGNSNFRTAPSNTQSGSNSDHTINTSDRGLNRVPTNENRAWSSSATLGSGKSITSNTHQIGNDRSFHHSPSIQSGSRLNSESANQNQVWLSTSESGTRVDQSTNRLQGTPVMFSSSNNARSSLITNSGSANDRSASSANVGSNNFATLSGGQVQSETVYQPAIPHTVSNSGYIMDRTVNLLERTPTSLLSAENINWSSKSNTKSANQGVLNNAQSHDQSVLNSGSGGFISHNQVSTSSSNGDLGSSRSVNRLEGTQSSNTEWSISPGIDSEGNVLSGTSLSGHSSLNNIGTRLVGNPSVLSSNIEGAVINKPGSETVFNTNNINYKHTSSTGSGQPFNENTIGNSGSFPNSNNPQRTSANSASTSTSSQKSEFISHYEFNTQNDGTGPGTFSREGRQWYSSDIKAVNPANVAGSTSNLNNQQWSASNNVRFNSGGTESNLIDGTQSGSNQQLRINIHSDKGQLSNGAKRSELQLNANNQQRPTSFNGMQYTDSGFGNRQTASSSQQSISSASRGHNSNGPVGDIHRPSSDINRQWTSSSSDKVGSRNVVDQRIRSPSNQRWISRDNTASITEHSNNYINFPPGLVLPPESINTNIVVTNYKTHNETEGTNNDQSHPSVVQEMGIPVGNFYTEYTQTHSAASNRYTNSFSEPTAGVGLNSQRNVGVVTNNWSTSNKFGSQAGTSISGSNNNSANIGLSNNSADAISIDNIHSKMTSGGARRNPNKQSLVYTGESSFVVSSPSVSSQSLSSSGDKQSLMQTESRDASIYTVQSGSSSTGSTGIKDHVSLNGKGSDLDLVSSSQHSNYVSTDQGGSDSINYITNTNNNTPETVTESGSSISLVTNSGVTASDAKSKQVSNQVDQTTRHESNHYVSIINQESSHQTPDVQQGPTNSVKTTHMSGSDTSTGSDSGISRGSTIYQGSSISNVSSTIKGKNDKLKATKDSVSNMGSKIGNDPIIPNKQASHVSNQTSVNYNRNQSTVQSSATLTSVTTGAESNFYDSTISEGGNTGDQISTMHGGSDATRSTDITQGNARDNSRSISSTTSQMSNSIKADKRNINDGPQPVDTGTSNALSSGQIQMINNENSKLTTFNSGKVSAYIVEKPQTVEGEKIPDDSSISSGLRMSEFTSDNSKYNASRIASTAPSTLQNNAEQPPSSQPQNPSLPSSESAGSSTNEIPGLGTVTTGFVDEHAFTSGVTDEKQSSSQSSTKTITDQADPLAFSTLKKTESSTSLSSVTYKLENATEKLGQDTVLSANMNINNQAQRNSPYSSSSLSELWHDGGESTNTGGVNTANIAEERKFDVNLQSTSSSSTQNDVSSNSNLERESSFALNNMNKESGTDISNTEHLATKRTSEILSTNADDNTFLSGTSDGNKAHTNSRVKLDQSISVPIDNISPYELSASNIEPHGSATSVSNSQQRQDDAKFFYESTNDNTGNGSENYGTSTSISSRSSDYKKGTDIQSSSSSQTPPVTGTESQSKSNLFYGFSNTDFNTVDNTQFFETSDNVNQIHSKSTDDKSMSHQIQGDGLIIGSESGYNNPMQLGENSITDKTNLPKYFTTDGKSGILGDTFDLRKEMDESKIAINSNALESPRFKDTSPSSEGSTNTAGTANVMDSTVTSINKGYDDLNTIPNPDADLSKSSLFKDNGNFVFRPDDSRQTLDESLNLGQTAYDYNLVMDKRGPDKTLSDSTPEIKPHRIDDSVMQSYGDSNNNVFYGFESFHFGPNTKPYPPKVHRTVNTNSMGVFLNTFEDGDMTRPFNKMEWHRIKTGKESRHNLGLSGNTLNVHVGDTWDQTPTVFAENKDSEEDKRRVFNGFGINRYNRNDRKFSKQSKNYIFRNNVNGDNKLLSIGESGGIFARFKGKKGPYATNTIDNENVMENVKAHTAGKENESKLNDKAKEDSEKYFTGFDTYWIGTNKLSQDDSLSSRNFADSSKDMTKESFKKSTQDDSLLIDQKIGSSSKKQEHRDDGFVFTGFNSYGYDQSDKETFDFSVSNRLHEYEVPSSSLSTNTYDHNTRPIKNLNGGDDKNRHTLNKVDDKGGMIFTGFDSFGDHFGPNNQFDGENTVFKPNQRSVLSKTDQTSKTFTVDQSNKIDDDANKSNFPLWRKKDEQLFTGFGSLIFGNERRETQIHKNNQQETPLQTSNIDDKRKTSSTLESYFDNNSPTNGLDDSPKLQTLNINTKTSAIQSRHVDEMLTQEKNNVYDDSNQRQNIEYVPASLTDTQPQQGSVYLGFNDIGNSESQSSHMKTSALQSTLVDKMLTQEKNNVYDDSNQSSNIEYVPASLTDTQPQQGSVYLGFNDIGNSESQSSHIKTSALQSTLVDKMLTKEKNNVYDDSNQSSNIEYVPASPTDTQPQQGSVYLGFNDIGNFESQSSHTKTSALQSTHVDTMLTQEKNNVYDDNNQRKNIEYVPASPTDTQPKQGSVYLGFDEIGNSESQSSHIKTSALQSTHVDKMLTQDKNNVYDDSNRNSNIEYVPVSPQLQQGSLYLGFDDVGNSKSQKPSELHGDDSNIDLMSVPTTFHNEQNLRLASTDSQSLIKPAVSAQDGYMVTTFPTENDMTIGYNQELTSKTLNFTTKSVDIEDTLPPAADSRLTLPVPELPSTLNFNALPTSTEAYTVEPTHYQSSDDGLSATSSTNEQFLSLNNKEEISKSNYHNVEISGDMRDNMLGGAVDGQRNQQSSKFWADRNTGNFGIHDDGINFVSPTTKGSILATTETKLSTETTAPTLSDLQKNTLLAESVSGIKTAEISSNGVWKQPITQSMFTSSTRQDDTTDNLALPDEEPSKLLMSDDLFTNFNFVSPPNTIRPTVNYDTQSDVIHTQTAQKETTSVGSNIKDNTIKINGDGSSTTYTNTDNYTGQRSNLLSSDVDRFTTKTDNKQPTGELNINTKSDFSVSSHSVYVTETTNRNDTHSDIANINANAMNQNINIYLPSNQESYVATTGTNVIGSEDKRGKQNTEQSTVIGSSSLTDIINDVVDDVKTIPNNRQATNSGTAVDGGGPRTRVDDGTVEYGGVIDNTPGVIFGQMSNTEATTDSGGSYDINNIINNLEKNQNRQSSYMDATDLNGTSKSGKTVEGSTKYIQETSQSTYTSQNSKAISTVQNTDKIVDSQRNLNSDQSNNGELTSANMNNINIQSNTDTLNYANNLGTGVLPQNSEAIYVSQNSVNMDGQSIKSTDSKSITGGNTIPQNQDTPTTGSQSININVNSNIDLPNTGYTKGFVQNMETISSQSNYVDQNANFDTSTNTAEPKITEKNKSTGLLVTINDANYIDQSSPPLRNEEVDFNTKTVNNNVQAARISQLADQTKGGEFLPESSVHDSSIQRSLSTKRVISTQSSTNQDTNTQNTEFHTDGQSGIPIGDVSTIDGQSGIHIGGVPTIDGQSGIHIGGVPTIDGQSGIHIGGISTINSGQTNTQHKEESKTGVESQPHSQQSEQTNITLEHLKSIGLGGSSNNQQFNPVTGNGNDYLRQQELERQRISMARNVAFSRSLLDDILIGGTNDQHRPLGSTNTQSLSGGITSHSATSNNLLKNKSDFNSVSPPLISNGENILIDTIGSRNNDAFTRNINRAVAPQNANSGGDGSSSHLQNSESSILSILTSRNVNNDPSALAQPNTGDLRAQGVDSSNLNTLISASNSAGDAALGQTSSDLLTETAFNGGSQSLINSGSLSAIQNGLQLSKLGAVNGGTNTLLREANNNIQTARVSQLAGQQTGVLDANALLNDQITDAPPYSGQEAITFANSLNGNTFTTTRPTVSTQEALILSNALNFNGVNAVLDSVGSGSLLGGVSGILNERASNNIGTDFTGHINNSPSLSQQTLSTSFSTSRQDNVISGPGIPSRHFTSAQHAASTQHAEGLGSLANNGKSRTAQTTPIVDGQGQSSSSSLNTKASSQSVHSSSSTNNVQNITRTTTNVESSSGNILGRTIEQQINNGQNTVNGGTLQITNRHGEKAFSVDSSGSSSPDSTIANFYKTSSFTIVSGRTPQNVCPKQSLVCGAKGDFALTFRSNLWCINNCLENPSACQNRHCNCHCIPSGFTEADLRGSFSNLLTNAYANGHSEISGTPGTIVSSKVPPSKASNSFHQSIVSSSQHSSRINSFLRETTPKPTAAPVTQAKIHQVTRNKLTSGRVLVCKGRGVFEQVDGMAQWCETECGQRQNPNCYTETCKCVLV